MISLVNIITFIATALISVNIGDLFALESFSESSNLKCKFQSDCLAASEAIERVEKFFKLYGYTLKPSVKIRFKKEVLVVLKEYPADKIATHGLYDPCTGWCEIPHGKERQSKKIFGRLDITEEFHISTIVHEVAHRYYHYILKKRNEKVSRAFHEFVAYVVQIHTMKEPEKSKVLGLWLGSECSSVECLNDFLWAVDPDRYAIMAYRLFLSKPDLIRAILGGEVKSVTGAD